MAALLLSGSCQVSGSLRKLLNSPKRNCQHHRECAAQITCPSNQRCSVHASDCKASGRVSDSARPRKVPAPFLVIPDSLNPCCPMQAIACSTQVTSSGTTPKWLQELCKGLARLPIAETTRGCFQLRPSMLGSLTRMIGQQLFPDSPLASAMLMSSQFGSDYDILRFCLSATAGSGVMEAGHTARSTEPERCQQSPVLPLTLQFKAWWLLAQVSEDLCSEAWSKPLRKMSLEVLAGAAKSKVCFGNSPQGLCWSLCKTKKLAFR